MRIEKATYEEIFYVFNRFGIEVNHINVRSETIEKYNSVNLFTLSLIAKHEKLAKAIFDKICDQEYYTCNQKRMIEDLCLSFHLSEDLTIHMLSFVKFEFNYQVSYDERRYVCDDVEGSKPLYIYLNLIKSLTRKREIILSVLINETNYKRNKIFVETRISKLRKNVSG
jgi:hypothetical protein